MDTLVIPPPLPVVETIVTNLLKNARDATPHGGRIVVGLENVEVIFRQEPKINGNLHFGSRLAFAPDGTLFVTLGERFQFTPAQDLSNDLGKIARNDRDLAQEPEDNRNRSRKILPTGLRKVAV